MEPQKPAVRNEFKPLDLSTLKQVWLWRNLPHIRTNMHNCEPISWDEHQKWFERLVQSDDKTFFVFWQNERPIGILNFSQTPKGDLEWGCYLGDENVWPGSGLLLEIAALDYALIVRSATTLQAEVLSFNKNVIKMHRFFGYQEASAKKAAGVRQGAPYDVLCFYYTQERWQTQRADVLARLPKQIAHAAHFIEFQHK